VEVVGVLIALATLLLDELEHDDLGRGHRVGLDAEGFGGGALRCISSSLSRSFEREGSCPVSISKKRTPRAWRSLGGPASSPRACTGDM